MPTNTPPTDGLTGPQKRSLAITAKDEAAVSLYSQMVRDSMTPARYNRKVTPEMAEIIMIRISEGDTLRGVCKELGISTARAKQYFRDFPEKYEAEWRMARADCAFSMADMIMEVAFNENESTERSKIKIDALKWIAERFNRDAFSQRQQIDHRHAVAYILPPGSDDL